MTICDRIEAQSMALAALPAWSAERAAAEHHAAFCAGCARALRQGMQLLALVTAELRPAEDAASLLPQERRLLEAVRPARRSRLLAAGGAVAVFVALVASAHQLAADPASWQVAGAAALIAAVLSALAPAGARTVAAALAASLGLALLAAGGPAASGQSGVTCLLIELGSGLLPLALWRLVRARTAGSVQAAAALAACTALSAQAALHLSCPVRGALPHLALHVAGVAAAALVAAWATLPRHAPRSTTARR
jgi:hypothetical protein